jgi:exosortase/archaeosortase family protein
VEKKGKTTPSRLCNKSSIFPGRDLVENDRASPGNRPPASYYRQTAMNKKGKKQLDGFSWRSLKAEWHAWFIDKAPVLLFGAKFGGFMLLLYGVLALPYSEKALYSYLEANARASNFILNIFGQGTHVTDVTIRSPGFAIAIRRGCDAIEPTGLLCGAILAFPALFRRKLAGMAAGLVILQTLNLIRIVTLFWIGSHFSKGLFNSVHLEIWPALFIVVAIVCFVGWRGWTLEK